MKVSSVKPKPRNRPKGRRHRVVQTTDPDIVAKANAALRAKNGRPPLLKRTVVSSVKPDLERSLALLSGSSPDTQQTIWRNCLRMIDDQKQSSENKNKAKALKEAIERYWQEAYERWTRDPDYWLWPTTSASGGDGRFGSLNFQDRPDEGVFSTIGYTVGQQTDMKANERHALLELIFVGFLPPIHSREYMLEWGGPKSSARLRKMAESLTAFTRNAKRRNLHRMDGAIARWEADLDFLHREYYVPLFKFGWPFTVR